MGDRIVIILACVNLVVATVYGYEGNWVKMWYWLAASQINWTIVLMRGV